MKSCAVIGAPPSQFKFKYNEKHTACKRLKRVMQKQFILLYQQGVHDFYIGSSLGTEIWASEILLRLKEDSAFSAIQTIRISDPYISQMTKFIRIHWEPDRVILMNLY